MEDLMRERKEHLLAARSHVCAHEAERACHAV